MCCCRGIRRASRGVQQKANSRHPRHCLHVSRAATWRAECLILTSDFFQLLQVLQRRRVWAAGQPHCAPRPTALAAPSATEPPASSSRQCPRASTLAPTHRQTSPAGEAASRRRRLMGSPGCARHQQCLQGRRRPQAVAAPQGATGAAAAPLQSLPLRPAQQLIHQLQVQQAARPTWGMQSGRRSLSCPRVWRPCCPLSTHR